mmetsp:Transcript_2202/g.3032  ORF Transcript_2202/g.3032 Transcript_2202/m.3032 type:complete len:211 (-) Transcript_2202:276-908(-)
MISNLTTPSYFSFNHPSTSSCFQVLFRRPMYNVLLLAERVTPIVFPLKSVLSNFLTTSSRMFTSSNFTKANPLWTPVFESFTSRTLSTLPTGSNSFTKSSSVTPIAKPPTNASDFTVFDPWDLSVAASVLATFAESSSSPPSSRDRFADSTCGASSPSGTSSASSSGSPSSASSSPSGSASSAASSSSAGEVSSLFSAFCVSSFSSMLSR